MSATRPSVSPGARPPVILALPFRGTWLARNSPARRVPSHGTDLLGTRYAIDFVAVDGRLGRGVLSAVCRTRRTDED